MGFITLGAILGLVIALPVGGIVCMLFTGDAKNIIPYAEFGLSKVINCRSNDRVSDISTILSILFYLV